jgi:hypothetical protein
VRRTFVNQNYLEDKINLIKKSYLIVMVRRTHASIY